MQSRFLSFPGSFECPDCSSFIMLVIVGLSGQLGINGPRLFFFKFYKTTQTNRRQFECLNKLTRTFCHKLPEKKDTISY